MQYVVAWKRQQALYPHYSTAIVVLALEPHPTMQRFWGEAFGRRSQQGYKGGKGGSVTIGAFWKYSVYLV
jgi:hypothetical protein